MPPYICEEDHKHEKSSTCYDRHGCRCDWCCSEQKARWQERRGSATPLKWSREELINEFEFLVLNGMSGNEAVKAFGMKRENVRESLIRKGRDDLVKYL
jgi:hypothetical protein